MTSVEKLIILNKAAITLRETLREIDEVFKEDKDVMYFLWKINKFISQMHKVIFDKMEHEVIEEDFKKIVKQLEKECEE
jgi:hypothetical protein